MEGGETPVRKRQPLLQTLPLRRERVVFLSVKLMIRLAERLIVAMVSAHHRQKTQPNSIKPSRSFTTLALNSPRRHKLKSCFEDKQEPTSPTSQYTAKHKIVDLHETTNESKLGYHKEKRSSVWSLWEKLKEHTRQVINEDL